MRSRDEVARFLDAVRGRVPRLLLRTTYAAGLRLGEACRLTPAQIDSQQMVLRVLGKGQKERVVPLAPQLLQGLRDDWRAVRPTPWLFPGKGGQQPIQAGTVQRACRQARRRAGLPRITPHTLRHCSASHLLAAGTDTRMIRLLLGHPRIGTTAVYTHLTTEGLRRVVSPRETLPTPPTPPG